MTAFAPLPGLAVTWQASTVAPDAFLRYVIYRREAGQAEWQLRHTVYSRSTTYWVDHRVAGGVVYEYTVAVVADVAGEEVVSELCQPAQGVVRIRDLWVHDEVSGAYVQVAANQIELGRSYETQPTRVWQYDRPVAVVGRMARRTVAATVTGQWVGAEARRSRQVDEAIQELDRLQRLAGARLWLRHGRGIMMRVVYDGTTVRHTPGGWSATLTFTEVHGGN